jgi:hypothetical protein
MLPVGLIAMNQYQQLASFVRATLDPPSPGALAIEKSPAEDGHRYKLKSDGGIFHAAPKNAPQDGPAKINSAGNWPEECRQLLDYWNALRADRLVPMRRMIDPGRIKLLLPFLLLIEERSATEARIRLAGTGLRDLFGFEPSGQNYIDLAPRLNRRERGYRMWQITHHPCGGRYTRRIPFPSGVRETCDGLLLPLTADRPDRPPLAIAVEMPRFGPRWLNRGRQAVLEPVDDFVFVDIGAGVPASAVPRRWP